MMCPVPEQPRWRRYLRFLGPDVEADIDDELQFHLDQRIADYVAEGHSPEEAERLAHERIGDVKVLRRELTKHDRLRQRSKNRTQTMRRSMEDLRLALRGFRRTPGFFATSVVILGIGIGASVAMFTVFRTVLLRELPVLEQDRIAVMWTYGADPTTDLSTGTKDLSVVRHESRTMSDIAAVAHWPAVASPFYYGDRPVELNRGMVTGNYFDVLGVRPALGRLLKPSDDEPPVPPPLDTKVSRALVLSYGAWQGKFGGDEEIVGRTLVEPLIGTEYTIVGVAPAGFDYPAGADYWIPMWSGWNSDVSAFAVARLAPGATVAAAREEYLAIERRLAAERPPPIVELGGAHAATFAETVLGEVRPVLLLLTAAVALLLLIGCLNVGNLLLLRASSRTQEIAVRRAMGAGFGDVVRQHLMEAVAIAAAGGVVGLLMSEGLLRLLVAYSPPSVPRLDEVQLAGIPVLTAVAVTAVAVLLFGLGPAVLAARGEIASPLRLDSRTGSDTRRRRTVRQTLVASQIALAVVMLGGAGLLARSLERLEAQDRGYSSDHLSILWFSWDVRRFDSVDKTVTLGDQLVKRIRAVPGVTAATQIVVPPMVGEGVWQTSVTTGDQDPSEASTDRMVAVEHGGPEYFRTFGIPLLRGRAFTDADHQGAPPVAIVSETLARRLWAEEDAIGKQIRAPGPTANPDGLRTVIGIAEDTHLRTLREPTPTVYVPALQGYWQGWVAIRSSTELGGLVPALRAAADEVAPRLDLWAPRTMDEMLAEPLAQPRLSALLMSTVGVVALLLAAIGLFGVMSSVVNERTRELGVRIALGATPGRVRRQVIAQAAVVVGVGLIAGLAAALMSSRLMTSLLFQISPTDPASLLGACVLLLSVAGIAAYLPARRATAIDPVEALRLP